jgi:two-component system response regulator PilR (NtrC family)
LKRASRTRSDPPNGRTEAGSALARRVLIVDDEADILELLELTLLRMGLEAERAMTVAQAMELLRNGQFDLCLTDMRLPDASGLDLVEEIGRNYPSVPVAVITAHGSLENAVAALKAGAFDYLAKPVSLAQLRALVKSALELPAAPVARPAEQCLLGDSPAMQQVRQMIEKLARSQAPVYVTGESGSGKELAARLIHEKSGRRDRPFIAVNCGAIPENLMESEFFGYKKGAFTGAEQDRDGFFQAASGGTLFLDEVADLPLPMQVKLLRAIQEKRVRKVGSTQEEGVDVRIISATHQNLGQCVEGGRFRQDLYYRLNVIELRMPALREMREDIPTIAQAILGKLARQNGAKAPALAPAALRALEDYPFPGNVRELENVLERALALCGEERISAEDLYLTPPEPEGGEGRELGAKWPLQEYLDRVEKEAIMEALERTRYNKTAAAKLLGITFRALRYRLERLGID